MLDIAVVDFPGGSNACKLSTGHRVRHLTSRWNGGSADLHLGEADVLFIFGNYTDTDSSTVHLNDHQRTQALLERGSLIVMFINNANTFHIQNLLNVPPGLTLGSVISNCSASSVISRTAFDPVLSRFGNLIGPGKLIGIPPDRQWEAKYSVTPFLGHSGGVVGAVVTSGRGCCVYLPLFSKPSEVMQAILEEVVHVITPHLIFDDKFGWIKDDGYLMPSVLAIRQRQRQTRADYEDALKKLDIEYEAQWSDVQKKWNRLLTETGDELKNAVKVALEYFGFCVEDVDEYWAESAGAGRQKEEDLWCTELPGPAHPSKPGVRLVEVKSSGKGATTESDYGAITKYLNRRKTECSNTDLRGLFVMNHHYLRPASERPAAFSPAIVKDAIYDGVTLVTTWDLFRLIQNMAAERISSDEIRVLLSNPGIVQL